MAGVDETTGTAGGAAALQQLVAASFASAGQSFAIPRDGLSPCVFEGRLLAEACGHGPGASLWYELAGYARNDGGFVAVLNVFRKSAAEKDTRWARMFRTLPELVTYFEEHDPAGDVAATDDLTDRRLHDAEAMIRAAALRLRLAEARAEYQATVGELLEALGDAG